MAEVFLGVGSNVAAERHLEIALAGLSAHFGVLAVSRVYRNPAVGCAGDDYLNLVVGVGTTLSPQGVQEVSRAIEQTAAQDPTVSRRGPRTLDIDLLVYGTLVDPLLKLPRDDVLQHAFVLCPMADLAPELCHPVSGQTMREAWRAHRGRASPWADSGWFLPWSLSAGGKAGGTVAVERSVTARGAHCAL